MSASLFKTCSTLRATGNRWCQNKGHSLVQERGGVPEAVGWLLQHAALGLRGCTNGHCP